MTSAHSGIRLGRSITNVPSWGCGSEASKPCVGCLHDIKRYLIRHVSRIYGVGASGISERSGGSFED